MGVVLSKKFIIICYAAIDNYCKLHECEPPKHYPLLPMFPLCTPTYRYTRPKMSSLHHVPASYITDALSLPGYQAGMMYWMVTPVRSPHSLTVSWSVKNFPKEEVNGISHVEFLTIVTLGRKLSIKKCKIAYYFY